MRLTVELLEELKKHMTWASLNAKNFSERQTHGRDADLVDSFIKSVEKDGEEVAIRTSKKFLEGISL